MAKGLPDEGPCLRVHERPHRHDPQDRPV